MEEEKRKWTERGDEMNQIIATEYSSRGEEMRKMLGYKTEKGKTLKKDDAIRIVRKLKEISDRDSNISGGEAQELARKELEEAGHVYSVSEIEYVWGLVWQRDLPGNWEYMVVSNYYEESKELHFLDRIPAACPHCGECCHHKVVDSYINYNRGDSMIDPHVHLNIIYQCYTCEQQFALRAYIPEGSLYYGDHVVGGAVEDESCETQERLDVGDVPDGFFREKGDIHDSRYRNRHGISRNVDAKYVFGPLSLYDGYYICVVKSLEQSELSSDAKKTLKEIVETIGVTREIWVASNKMIAENKSAEEIFSYLKKESRKLKELKAYGGDANK